MKHASILQRRYREKLKRERPWMLFLMRCRARCGNKSDKYIKKGIKSFLVEEEIKYLWFRDKAWLLKKVSIDRIDNSGNYTLDNCRFIEWWDNCTAVCRPKKIIQMDLQGREIKTWRSISSATKELNLDGRHLWRALYEKPKKGYWLPRKRVGKFLWKDPSHP